MTALITGNRFGRGLVRPGGVAFDVDDALVAELLKRLDAAERDLTGATTLLWDTPSVRARFEEVGTIRKEDALALGLVGPAARASGVERDARYEFPTGIYRLTNATVSTAATGDVLARALVRWLEAHRSMTLVREILHALPEGPARVGAEALAPDSLAASVTEGWRGEIWHIALTDAGGRLAHYKIVDPSFHNWMGLAYAMRGQDISDFPLSNKSFNLSYCGHDL
jgi:Ni,Fe-hydrogenase III large subunit